MQRPLFSKKVIKLQRAFLLQFSSHFSFDEGKGEVRGVESLEHFFGSDSEQTLKVAPI